MDKRLIFIRLFIFYLFSTGTVLDTERKSIVLSKKKMSLHYLPAVCKELKYRWYIEYWQFHPILNKKVRFRETYDLNRIKDLDLRRSKAVRVCNHLNEKLPFGWPYENLFSTQKEISIKEGMKMGLEVKLNNTGSVDTRNTYNSMVKMFVQYLDEHKIGSMSIHSFTKAHANQYLIAMHKRKQLASVTYNSYINVLKSIFFVLVDLEYIHDNPFSKIKKKKVGSKRRRAFSEVEKTIVSDAVKDYNKYLYLGVVLQYYCFIRPKELRFLKPNMFSFVESVIRIPGSISKNVEDDIVTIPDIAFDEICELIKGVPKNYFIFGSCLRPNSSRPCSKNYMNMKHRDIIGDLHKRGLIDNIDGLTFYSWKDTGATYLFKNNVNPREIMDQMRHKSLEYTQRYSKSLYVVNRQIKGLENRL